MVTKMNDEKKPNPKSNDDNQRNRHHKPKGYFIAPSQEKGDKAQHTEKQQAQNNKNQPQREKREQADLDKKAAFNKNENPNQKSQQGGGHSRNRRRKKHHHNAEKIAQIPAEITNSNIAANDSAKNENERKHHGKKNRSYQNPQIKVEVSLLGSIEDIEEKSVSKPSEIVEILDPADIPSSILESPVSVNIPSSADYESPRTEVVGIRFKSSGKMYYFDPNGKKYSRATHAIVETARGLEYGSVSMGNTFVKSEDIVPPLRPVIRAATQADEDHHKENQVKEHEAFKICNEKIIAHKLDMKLIDAQYTFDNSKLLFYFTSSGRVDFRELVKDLASAFHTRIELRQIGIRDEAKLMGGLGLCGRPLCCSLFLSDFGQVSIKMAKEQNLSLNSAKISGICGRLMCCLRYEHDTYEYEIKRTPPVDSLVKTPDGNGVVTETNPLAATVKVRLSATPEVPPKTYKRDDVTLIQKKAPKNNDNQ